jgi:hypothetical protein
MMMMQQYQMQMQMMNKGPAPGFCNYSFLTGFILTWGFFSIFMLFSSATSI